jgi:hypothetical protein
LDSEVFISSCSRRQLARRRWARTALRYEFLMMVIGVLLAFAAFVVGHGGL